MEFPSILFILCSYMLFFVELYIEPRLFIENSKSLALFRTFHEQSSLRCLHFKKLELRQSKNHAFPQNYL